MFDKWSIGQGKALEEWWIARGSSSFLSFVIHCTKYLCKFPLSGGFVIFMHYNSSVVIDNNSLLRIDYFEMEWSSLDITENCSDNSKYSEPSTVVDRYEWLQFQHVWLPNDAKFDVQFFVYAEMTWQSALRFYLRVFYQLAFTPSPIFWLL